MEHEATTAPRESAHEDVLVKTVLQVGLGVASLLMLMGLILRAAEHRTGAPPAPLFHLVRAGDLGSSCTAVGILVLALTPVARIVSLELLWLKERDWRFVGVATIVLFTLGISMVLGRG